MKPTQLPTVAKPRPIPQPDPGILLPGETGDVALGKVRRQIEVPRVSLDAPRLALLSVLHVAYAASGEPVGDTTQGERLTAALMHRLEEAQEALDQALRALDQLELAVTHP
jgi:hypothetical protein